MPAPQQSQNSVYKETSNIPRPRLADYMHDVRDNGAYKLAKALGVGIKKVGAKYQENKNTIQQQDDAINAAHAQAGLERFNRDQSAGALDMITGDFEPDTYDAKRGSVEGALFSGQLRDKYMADKVYENTDHTQFSKWMTSSISEQAEAAKAKGPSYYATWIKEVAKNSEQMGLQYANSMQDVLGKKSQEATKERMKMTIATDRAVTKAGEIGGWMKGFLGSESASNWNAWYGNSQNKEDLSQLTLGEIYKRQQAPGNDAAGLIQIIPSTLKGVMNKYGYSEDTKFTPQIQTEMALLLMKEQGLDKWLRNEISDGQMANNAAKIWAGLKTSGGKGVYDHDGVNKGTQDHSMTAKQLAELRYLLDQNPDLKAWIAKKEPKAGEAVALLNAPGVNTTNTAALINSPSVTGLSEKQGRDVFVDIYSDEIKNGGKLPSPDEVETLGKNLKLSKAQREKINEEVSRAQSTKEYQDAQARVAAVAKVDAAITGNPEALEEIRNGSPKTYAALMKAFNGQTDISPEDQAYHTEEFRKEAHYGSPEFAEKAMLAFVEGRISKQTYTAQMQQHKAQEAASNIIRIPAVYDYVSQIEGLLPENVQGKFRSGLAMELSTLSSQYQDAGGIPPLSVIMETAQKLSQGLSQLTEMDTTSRMTRTAL